MSFPALAGHNGRRGESRPLLEVGSGPARGRLQSSSAPSVGAVIALVTHVDDETPPAALPGWGNDVRAADGDSSEPRAQLRAGDGAAVALAGEPAGHNARSTG